MGLDGEYDRDNIFAKILRGELPAAKVYEDESALAFLDLFPQSRGHTLVLPKVSARNLFDIEAAALESLILRVQKVARGVRAALKPDAVALMQFNGQASGQSVFHLHFHIIPRWEGVPMKGHGQAGMADKEALAALAQEIAAAIR
jgi:histidine triad (HIT) family protein